MEMLRFITAASLLCVASALPESVLVFVNALMTWPDAQSFCRQNFLDLVTVSSVEDVTLLTNMVDLDAMVYMNASFKHRAWIGLYDDLNSWRWSITDPNFYRDGEAAFRSWNVGEPNNYQGKESCVAMVKSGKFADVQCAGRLKPVCCDVQGHDASFVFINQTMSWPAAQSFCRQHHTDLASVRSSSESEQIKGLVQSAGENAVWIGLYRNYWSWADGSNVTFRHWRPTEPNGAQENCAVSALGDGGVWEALLCSRFMPFFCYDVPGSMQVVKVKLVESSSLDLSDPAALAGLLQQLEQKLKKDSRVEGDVKLRWIGQSGGRIFHQDE